MTNPSPHLPHSHWKQIAGTQHRRNSELGGIGSALPSSSNSNSAHTQMPMANHLPPPPKRLATSLNRYLSPGRDNKVLRDAQIKHIPHHNHHNHNHNRSPQRLSVSTQGQGQGTEPSFMQSTKSRRASLDAQQSEALSSGFEGNLRAKSPLSPSHGGGHGHSSSHSQNTRDGSYSNANNLNTSVKPTSPRNSYGNGGGNSRSHSRSYSPFSSSMNGGGGGSFEDRDRGRDRDGSGSDFNKWSSTRSNDSSSPQVQRNSTNMNMNMNASHSHSHSSNHNNHHHHHNHNHCQSPSQSQSQSSPQIRRRLQSPSQSQSPTATATATTTTALQTLLQRMLTDAESLDYIRLCASHHVSQLPSPNQHHNHDHYHNHCTESASTTASVSVKALHGMIEEVITMFRTSSEITLSGFKDMVIQLNLQVDTVKRLRSEMEGLVRDGEDREQEHLWVVNRVEGLEGELEVFRRRESLDEGEDELRRDRDRIRVRGEKNEHEHEHEHERNKTKRQPKNSNGNLNLNLTVERDREIKRENAKIYKASLLTPLPPQHAHAQEQEQNSSSSAFGNDFKSTSVNVNGEGRYDGNSTSELLKKVSSVVGKDFGTAYVHDYDDNDNDNDDDNDDDNGDDSDHNNDDDRYFNNDSGGVNNIPFSHLNTQSSRSRSHPISSLSSSITKKSSSNLQTQAEDKTYIAKTLLKRLNHFIIQKSITLTTAVRHKLDINDDGYLSFDELSDAFKVIGIDSISYGDVIILHKYLAGDEELCSIDDFFENLLNPPYIEKRNFVWNEDEDDDDEPIHVRRHASVGISNIDLDTNANANALNNHNQALKIRDVQKPLGDLSSNSRRRRSQEAREGGWKSSSTTGSESKSSNGFGNVFEANANAKYDSGKNSRRNSTSTHVFGDGDGDDDITSIDVQMKLKALTDKLGPCPQDATAIFKKIATYIKSHRLILTEIIENFDIHQTGRLTQSELKHQITHSIGIHVTTGEVMFMFRWLGGAKAKAGGVCGIEEFKIGVFGALRDE